MTDSHQIDNILHSLLQARHAQIPYLKLYRFLCEDLACRSHGMSRSFALGRFLLQLLMELTKMGHREFGGGRTLFQMKNVLCHVVEPNKVMLALVAVDPCLESHIVGHIESQLDCYP